MFEAWKSFHRTVFGSRPIPFLVSSSYDNPMLFFTFISSNKLHLGHFVVNIGDTLSLWTNGIFMSTIHRAYNIEGKTRLSVPIFFGADDEAVIKTLPTCITPENPLKFKPVTSGDYYRDQIHLQYPDGKKSAPVSAVPIDQPSAIKV